jgi:D-xylose 1-dehydrogenase (NADP+, D-xylono-1,5-lactone-forming)
MDEGVAGLRWGILSTANIGRAAVIPAIKESTRGEVVAVASRESRRAEEFAAENGIPEAFGSYEELLEDEHVDAIYIPLPNNMHREWTIRAAEAGKHVLCEKPLALTATECDEMADAAENAGVVCMEAFMYRFHPRIHAVTELIASGAIGELRSMYSAFTFKLTTTDNIRLDPGLGGGSLMDVGCYCVNVFRTIAASEPLEVQAQALWTDRGVDEQMAGFLRFEGGRMAQFDCALTMERREALHVAGTDGHLEVPRVFIPGTDDVTIEEFHGRGDAKSHALSGVNEYTAMVEHFTDSILTGSPVRYPFSEAAANMRVLEALYRSAWNGGQAEPVRDE